MPRHRSRSRERNIERRRQRKYSSNDSHDSYYSPPRRSSNKKKKNDKKNKKEKKTKRSRRSPSTSSKSSVISESSVISSKSSRSLILSDIKRNASDISSAQNKINLNVLDDQVNSKTLDMLNDDTFQAKIFTSRSNKSSKVIIDLQKDTILIPTSGNISEPTNESIFHPNFLGDESTTLDKWVKKLYGYRKKFYSE